MQKCSRSPFAGEIWNTIFVEEIDFLTIVFLPVFQVRAMKRDLEQRTSFFAFFSRCTAIELKKLPELYWPYVHQKVSLVYIHLRSFIKSDRDHYGYLP